MSNPNPQLPDFITAAIIIAIPLGAYIIGYLKGRGDGHHKGVVEELTRRINK